MLADLTGRLAVVTGAGRASGLGAGIAAVLARHGARVVATDIDVSCSQHVAELAAGADLSVMPLDVTSASAVRQAFGEIGRRFGPVEILVNNAGVGAGEDEAGWRQTYEVNVHGVVRCCQAALSVMRSRRYGKIINVTSISGHAGRGSAGSYGTSKAAVLRYTKGLAVDEARHDINVNAVCPGAVWTDMQQLAFSPANACMSTVEPSESSRSDASHRYQGRVLQRTISKTDPKRRVQLCNE